MGTGACGEHAEAPSICSEAVQNSSRQASLLKCSYSGAACILFKQRRTPFTIVPKPSPCRPMGRSSYFVIFGIETVAMATRPLVSSAWVLLSALAVLAAGVATVSGEATMSAGPWQARPRQWRSAGNALQLWPCSYTLQPDALLLAAINHARPVQELPSRVNRRAREHQAEHMPVATCPGTPRCALVLWSLSPRTMGYPTLLVFPAQHLAGSDFSSTYLGLCLSSPPCNLHGSSRAVPAEPPLSPR